MENELKEVFDIIVLGTGFTESLIAAAAARVGKRVLHLDRNEFYGGQWASFSIGALQEWAKSVTEKRGPLSSDEISADCLAEGETTLTFSIPNSLYSGLKHQWYIPNESVEESNEESKSSSEVKDEKITESPKKETEEVKSWSKNELEKINSKFNIDLAPKILFSRGALVELLISSNVARYVEFKCITRVLTWVDETTEGKEFEGKGKLVNVPCSRSSVFTTDVISLVEKRLLMKFLEFCYSHEQNQEEWADFKDKPFREFLTSRNLTPKLIHFITSAIGMVDEEVDCSEGLRKTSLFLNSLGRYGTMPFLFSLYGSGEMPQAFCRLCAVFEGIYILRKDVEYLCVNAEGAFTGVVSGGQRFKGLNLVMNAGYAPESAQTNLKKHSLSRGIFLTDRSIMPDEKEHLTILRMPSSEGHAAVTVIEVGSGCAVCPKKTFLVHLTCIGEDAKADLKVTSDRLFRSEEEDEEGKPKLLFSLFFNQIIYDLEPNGSMNLPQNTYLCSGPDASLDYDDAILQAKQIFSTIFPGEEFLPRAPDHNDIVFDSGDEVSKEASTDGESSKEGKGTEGLEEKLEQVDLDNKGE